MTTNPVYVSKKGGFINCYKVGNGHFLYHVTYENSYIFSNDLKTAKKKLRKLELLRSKSGTKTMKAIKKYSKGLRKFVEAAAAPYLTGNINSK